MALLKVSTISAFLAPSKKHRIFAGQEGTKKALNSRCGISAFLVPSSAYKKSRRISFLSCDFYFQSEFILLFL